MSSFVQAVREGAFSTRNHGHLVEETVTTTLAHVTQTFRSNNRKDPRLDIDGKTCFILQERFRGYSNQDGAKKKQKAFPIMVLRKLLELSSSPLEEALGYLCIGAIFFAMRSCEYLKSTHREDNKRTRILRLRNIMFKREGYLLHHNSRTIITADLVIITCAFQKNTKRNKTVHTFKPGDKILCPVKAWAHTIRQTKDTIAGAGGDTMHVYPPRENTRNRFRVCQGKTEGSGGIIGKRNSGVYKG